MSSLPSVLDLENASLTAWPAHEEVRDGGLVARFAQGYSRRANSLQSLDVKDETNIEARLAAMRQEFADRNVAFQFRATPLAGPALQEVLRSQGWVESDHNHVMAMALRKVVRPVAARTQLFEATDPQWLASQTQMAGRENSAEALSGILSRLSTPAKAILVYNEDLKPVAAALVVIADGIAIMLNVVVAIDYRGMGYGRAVMHAAINWAAHSKARFAALQVEAGNEKAVALYTSLGFVPQYKYVYWIAPQ